MTKVYVLIRTDGEGNDAVISVYATRASAEAQREHLQHRGELGLDRVFIEEHDLTP